MPEHLTWHPKGETLLQHTLFFSCIYSSWTAETLQIELICNIVTIYQSVQCHIPEDFNLLSTAVIPHSLVDVYKHFGENCHICHHLEMLVHMHKIQESSWSSQ